MLVFIDESGDPGFKVERGSSAVFVAALVAFREDDHAKRTQAAIESLSERLRISGEFKFNKSRPEIRDAFFAAVLPFDFCVRAIVVEKAKIYSPHLREHKESFYSFFVKSMLKFDGGLLQNAKVIIDGSGDRVFKKELKTYLRRHLRPQGLKSISINNSMNDRLVQLADMNAGAIARSYKPDRDHHMRWRDMLKPKIEDVWEFR